MIERRINERVRRIEPYVAGSTKDEVARKHGLKPEEVIKLASNENPFGPSPRVVEAIKRYADQVSRYPEDYPGDLIRAISSYLDMPASMILTGGNGADEVMDIIIKLLVSQGDEVIIPTPTFPYYELLVKLYGGDVVKVPMVEEYSVPIDDVVRRVNNRTKLIIICSPNNPTGSVVSEEGLRRALETGVPVMLDEAYVEFAAQSFTSLVKEYENLMVLRTFSKAFGLAGLRVGYGVAREEMIKNAMKIRPPHSVSLLAQKAAEEALRDLGHMKKAVEEIKKLRKAVSQELSRIPGVRVFPSHANFLLMTLEEKDAGDVIFRLEERGIIVRGCSGFGLDNSIRVTIGTRLENREFIKGFKEVLE